MDVLTTAWVAAGQPWVPDPGGRGTCARCGNSGTDLAATREVVSRVFTGYDGWVDPSGPGLCPACAWGYRTRALRTAAHMVIAHPLLLQQLSPVRLGDLLTEPLSPQVAVVVPLRPGRKHLFPAAVWGRVTVEDACLPWTGADATRLGVMRRLRALGFRPRMLTEPAPAWSVLRRLPRTWWSQVGADWDLLEPWRTRRPWFDLAAHACHGDLQVAS